MDRLQPKRLTKKQYMFHSDSFRIFHQHMDQRVNLHWHEFYEVSYILSGQGYQIMNGKKYSLQKGSIYFLTPADFHEIVPENGTMELYNLIFSEEVINDELYSLLFIKSEDYVHSFPDHEADIIRSEFERIVSEINSARIGRENMILGALERILIELIRHCSGENESRTNTTEQSEQNDPIRRALIYLNHFYRDPLTLTQVASQAQMSSNYFSEQFRKKTGISFQTYLQNLRLEFANKLLRVSNLPITEICHASGFNTLSHFERVYKKKYGRSPRDSRNQ